ncbi:MAG: GldG family protein, partial [Clostridiales bacterium]|nr:GldG family protein [Clostridiales bacterium]
STRLDNLLNGIVDLQSILYFLTVIGICLFLTYMTLERKRWTISARGLKKGIVNSITIIVIPVILIALNIGAGYLPEAYTKLDITDEKLYSITDTTKEFLANLDQDITIYVLGSEDSADITIKTLLTRYTSQSDRITVIYKDTAVYPNFASGYTTETLADNSMIVECGDKSTVIAFDDCYEYEVDYTTYESTATGFDGEGQITSALSYVTSDSLPTIWFLSGHNEYAEISETVTSNIKKENIAMETVNLMNYELIPDTISSVVICGPVVDYSADDIDKLNAYMENGGKIIILAAFSDQDMPNLNGFIKEYGLEVQDGVVFENNENNYYQYPYYVLPTVNSNTITANITKNSRYILMPQPVGMVETAEEEADLSVSVLLESSDLAICKTDVTNMESWEFEEGDIKGPFVLGASVTQTSTNAQLVIYACEYLVADDFDSLVSGANSTLFSDTVASMVDHESSIAIPVKEYLLSSIMMNQTTIIIMSIIIVGILPIATLIIGITIWIIRKKK